VTAVPAAFRVARFTTERYPFMLFYDGDCSFCNRWVYRVKEADPTHRMRYSPKQGLTFPRLLETHPELAEVKSVILVRRRADGGEDVFVRSSAIREVIAGLPKFRLFQFVLGIVPTFLADIGYNFFAKHRSTLVGRWHHIRRPIEQDQERYVE
jgi:predicted DCC family thiol-disulfide oxidoreductase YuxK